MKKTYTKPALYAESFELAEHIAATCAGTQPGASTHWNSDTCGFRLDGPGTGAHILFNVGVVSACTAAGLEDSVVDCYNTLENNMQPFSS